MNTTRRDFLKVGAGAVAATSAVLPTSNESFYSIASGRSAAAPAGDEGNMIYRRFGRTDVHISAIGVGGHHLGDVPTLDEAVQLVHGALRWFVIVFHSPHGVVETGLRVCPAEKKAAKPPCAVRWDTFSGPVQKQKLRNCGDFQRFSGECSRVSLQLRLRGGGRGIRTLGTGLKPVRRDVFVSCTESTSSEILR